VSQRITVDHDYRGPESWEQKDTAQAELRQRCPVAWSDYHDGHWMVLRAAESRAVLKDPVLFSSEKALDEDGVYHGGANIPVPQSPPNKPLEMGHSPRTTSYRRLIGPFLVGKPVEALIPSLERWTRALVDKVVENGRMDVVKELGNPLPALATLQLIGVPNDEWERFADPNHAIMAYEHDSPEWLEAAAGMQWIREELLRIIHERRKTPRDDMVSTLAAAEVEGEPIPDEDIVSMLMVTISGGVDTTTVALANIIMHLDTDQNLRQQLIAEPTLIPVAVDEFLRVYPPVTALCRTATQTVELGGQELSPGDRVLLAVKTVNNDPDAFPSPEKFVLDRTPNPHQTFGHGEHKCAGRSVARAELVIMLSEILRRMPDYRVERESAERYPSWSHLRGYVALPMTFTPGGKAGEELPGATTHV
jgi:cytochrome P450